MDASPYEPTRPSRLRLLLEHFSRIEDKRRPEVVAHKLNEIVLLCVCATIAECDSFDAIADWGSDHLEHRQRLRTDLAIGFARFRPATQAARPVHDPDLGVAVEGARAAKPEHLLPAPAGGAPWARRGPEGGLRRGSGRLAREDGARAGPPLGVTLPPAGSGQESPSTYMSVAATVPPRHCYLMTEKQERERRRGRTNKICGTAPGPRPAVQGDLFQRM